MTDRDKRLANEPGDRRQDQRAFAGRSGFRSLDPFPESVGIGSERVPLLAFFLGQLGQLVVVTDRSQIGVMVWFA